MLPMPPQSAEINAWLSFLTPLMVAVSMLINKWRGDQAARKLDKVHALVDGQYSVSLNLGASALEKVAASTRSLADIKAATAARKLSDDHESTIAKIKANETEEEG
jgi:hypothetical protein